MATISLSFEAIDDLIYDARSGDFAALKTDIDALATQHACSPASIVASAIDAEPESEGGSGACLLHFPAANGNHEILSFLLSTLTSGNILDQAQILAVVNHQNHSGNTPLHWAALNTHLPCVKALVEAGADLSVKNAAGHDAVFLAERTAWAAETETEAETEEQQDQQEVEVEVSVGEEAEQDAAPRKLSPGEEVVEWLLGCDKGAGLESGVAEP
ncbi:hypothetical protein ASPZODRAFT_1597687 [Penicilliopsis zonata CBS 506.65]|uniref:Uncharacterized protein n=1 Tax=Penicilliopsis zonata CBS 506.65 TaxID=1073090 RepID=A0A1L9SN21_9EURO|nr:hypothetical protein ASPZODRAFT_1597687 [Penicilliopsis zonata CBS 506.65]OJJ48437.1 hypothetical protein ASPZODRAFT_1597687 [Penicilliopsis zonata CBS 506.65]